VPDYWRIVLGETDKAEVSAMWVGEEGDGLRRSLESTPTSGDGAPAEV
jgi:hypothetical protein